MSKVVVIGACGGIGSAICLRLLDKGWKVYGGDIVQSHPASLKENPNYKGFYFDVTETDRQLLSGFDEPGDEFEFDAIIFAAGTYDHFPLAEADPGRLNKLLAVNVTGAANSISTFFKFLNKESGRIVLVSSETALASLPFQVYGVSKGMLEVYADSLRQELAFLNIPVTVIRPGAHTTELLDKSRSALAGFSPKSLFSRQLAKVRDEGQAIIDKGSADPGEVGRTVLKALTSSHPRKVYHVNVSLRFRAMRRMPASVLSWVVRQILR